MNPKEIECIRKYLDSVDLVTSEIFSQKINYNEENLTVILCLLLDENSPLKEKLKYNLDELNIDLKKYNSKLGFKLVTNEHNKHYESNYSQADIGFVFTIKNPEFGTKKKPMLIQCKKLYPEAEKFSLKNKYKALKVSDEQFKEIKKLKKKKYNFCYLFYNPLFTSFFREDCMQGMQYEHSKRYGGCSTSLSNPGIKITNTETIEYILGLDETLSLENFYEYGTSRMFEEFSSFIIDILKCNYDIIDEESRDEQILLCEGKIVKKNVVEDYEKNPAKNTIYINYEKIEPEY
ncbi:MAG: hypothetical protein LBM96_04900 [Methanobrevibacter sp.]|jgi:hypothetical protein|nr:hypothetical protein [Candidatus Methanoflexus mossambicus]